MKSTRLPYCSTCGAPTLAAVPDGDDRMRDVCGECGEVHYQNPKVIVGSVCTSAGKLLLCRRAIEPRKGFWTIPAGFMELGETAEQGAEREAWEEARAKIAIRDLIAVYSIVRVGQVQLHYRADLLNDDVAPGAESLEVELIEWHEIPWQDLAFPSVHWVLRRALELRHQSGPVVPEGAPTH